ncbi:Glycyl-tRNA synthetase beta chain [Nitrincola lacisaponensis]|uniref:Glycine--tRNA ligase beta subunit n=1 Tax=Nitrincola lacisaponensis TaxID=267850 RepID=A0A063Y6T2_9GAMM|nr:glycine--tRNA ligase subunit beta [Nitrincola lacisaponensis]KDE41399.1 Glycyl-tRNA synthetase beta chain [Nitrincola lacisaponensis]
MSTQDFLVELGTEELPPTSLNTLASAFQAGIEQGLQQAGLNYQSARFHASPRRLAVYVEQLQLSQPDREFEKRGPATQAPAQAVEGFARSCGVSVDALQTTEVGKGQYYVYRGIETGKPASELLPDIVNESLNQLPIPKRMRWGSRRTEFVRPVHWLMMLLGETVIPCTLLGLTAGRKTRGHRFHYPHDIEILSPQDYVTKLENPGHVLVDVSKRRETIRQQVMAEAQKLNAQVVIDEDLLDEVTALNEWPVTLTGRFEERFLAVPSEALISSMKANQKYFHLVDGHGKLLPHFITVSNIASTDPAQIISGNEKVIRPRLADAAFFFEQDRQTPLAARIEKLKSIVFQHDLGTLHQKTERVQKLAASIARLIDGNPDYAERAAELSKCDLMTNMVFEFTELQGLMGYHYALHDGEPEEVALALNEQYMPRFAGDQLPVTKTGMALALADRIDTITGLFAINQPPTGSKDPFALRRQSLGVLRILIEHQLDLDLEQLVSLAASNYPELPGSTDVVKRVIDFILERFRAWYDEQGVNVSVYLAVHALRPTRPLDFDKRVKAVSQFSTLAEASDLAAANKRVANILAKQSYNQSAGVVDKALLSEEAEQELATAVELLSHQAKPLFAQGKYTEAMMLLASLNPQVNRFFDEVMVMADDESVRHNRLSLLAHLRELFLGTADISLL